ncbi:FMN-dependent NADH-azoreductase [Caulobacter sp. 602-1]|uniref:FMN-dependent NADH-azoreductase n=1 Tax=Caulobacter sp. 602-1 TaxID=2492472 RepID=UPI000F643B89|nr:NAD(P)H-dependent oxidoreductase [Caulobacter sp. 602-1]RRN63520.1 FMN-dependent NADH-azoreductase [Caulobacter sp. 602-1]
MRLLHIDSSVQGANAPSRTLSALIVERLTAAAPTLQVTYRDLSALLSLDATPERGPEPDAKVLEEFLAANIVVIGAPLHNLGLPSPLKAWIDRIVSAGATFQYGRNELALGLASDKCVVIAYSRGDADAAGPFGAGDEHAASHLRAAFNFLGVADVEFIAAEGPPLGHNALNTVTRVSEEVDNILSTFKSAA